MKDTGTMSGMATDQADRMIETIRELDGRLWAPVLVRGIHELLRDDVWNTDWLLKYLRDRLDDC
jgi:hypothetical protein